MMETSQEAGSRMWIQLSPSESFSQELAGALLATPNLTDDLPVLHLTGSDDWSAVQDEETRELCDPSQFQPPPPAVPVSPLGPPTRGNFAGPFEFEVQVNGGDTNKKKYLYSHLLNRIYVDMKVDFPVQFRWEWETAARPLLVRATTVFSDHSQSEKRVERCLQHVHPNNNVGMDSSCRHVLQSTRPPNTDGVFYCGDHEVPLSWFSVAVQFPQQPATGASCFTHAYTFQCKSSCNSGINRRSVEIFFTLEDLSGKVYGRQSVGVRVCSCPRRDLSKDETTAPVPPGKRRKPTAATLPTTKKVKTEPTLDDVTVYSMPPVVGRSTYKMALIQVRNNMMVSAMVCSDEDKDVYVKYIQEYEKAIQMLEDE